jgi:hypothetical protein
MRKKHLGVCFLNNFRKKMKLKMRKNHLGVCFLKNQRKRKFKLKIYKKMRNLKREVSLREDHLYICQKY